MELSRPIAKSTLTWYLACLRVLCTDACLAVLLVVLQLSKMDEDNMHQKELALVQGSMQDVNYTTVRRGLCSVVRSNLVSARKTGSVDTVSALLRLEVVEFRERLSCAPFLILSYRWSG